VTTTQIVVWQSLILAMGLKMNEVNKLLLKGNIAVPPLVLKNGVVKIRLAVDNKSQTPYWFDIVCFKDVAQEAASFGIGDLVSIDGCLKNNNYVKTLADGTEKKVYSNDIIANSVNLIFSKDNNRDATN
jgi:single-stranded DNA-binding protein